MHELKADAYGMKESLLKGNFRSYGEFMSKSWEAKKKLAASISTRHIEQVYDAAMNAGAVAGKVSERRRRLPHVSCRSLQAVDVIRALEKQDGRVMICHLTTQGSEAWKIY